jgi:long-chain acyl-CoA synthetase
LSRSTWTSGPPGREESLAFARPEDLYDNPAFVAIVDRHSRPEPAPGAGRTIKYYRIISTPFSEQTGELTPSLKIKRKVIQEKYRDVIESMYPAGGE